MDVDFVWPCFADEEEWPAGDMVLPEQDWSLAKDLMLTNRLVEHKLSCAW